MLQFSREQRKKTFRDLFVHGSLFHIQGYGFDDYTLKDKYLLVMRGLATDEECYFFLPTSQVDKHRKNPIYQDSLYIFPEGSISYFPTETAIVVTNFHCRPYQRFETRYVDQPKGRHLDYLMSVPSHHMEAICKLIDDSDEISPFHKRQLISKPDQE